VPRCLPPARLQTHDGGLRTADRGRVYQWGRRKQGKHGNNSEMHTAGRITTNEKATLKKIGYAQEARLANG
jgi:hypothetical protein